MATDGVANGVSPVAALLGRRLGARRAWVVCAPDAASVLDRLDLASARDVATLGGVPLRVCDLRSEGRRARDAGGLLVVDNTLATSALCPAARLGAHVVVEGLDSSVGESRSELVAVALGRDADAPLESRLAELLGEFPSPDPSRVSALAAGLGTLDERMHAASDAAQVVASYLACHPAVLDVRYPGLTRDPSFSVASGVLVGGFGPSVDMLPRASSSSASWRRISCWGRDAPELVGALERSLVR